MTNVYGSITTSAKTITIKLQRKQHQHEINETCVSDNDVITPRHVTNVYGFIFTSVNLKATKIERMVV